MKNKKNILYVKISFILLIFSFSFSFVSSATLDDDVPDLCMNYNNTYDLNMHDYVTYDPVDTDKLKVKDPVNDNILNVLDGYYTLNLECYEVYNYPNGSLIWSSYDEECFVYAGYYAGPSAATFMDGWNVYIGPYYDGTGSCEYCTHDSNCSVGQYCDNYKCVNGSSGFELLDGLIHYYPLDEEVGNIAYDSESNIDLDNNGVSNGVTGKYLFAYDFDNSNDNLTAESNSTINGAEAFTISLWVNSDVTDQHQVFFNLGDSASTGKGIYVGSNPDGKFYVTTYGSDISLLSNNSFSAGVWYNVILTYSGSVARLYVNGQYHDSDSYVMNIDSAPYYVGIRNNGARDFDGTIDDILVWNRSLNQSHVTQVYTSLIPSTNLTKLQDMSNLYLNQDNVFACFDANEYFDDWYDVYFTYYDSLLAEYHNITTGYAFYDDYYDVNLSSYGALCIEANNLTWSHGFQWGACDQYNNCTSTNFTLYIDGENATDVEVLRGFPLGWDVGNDSYVSVPINTYFYWYDGVEVLFYNETNESLPFTSVNLSCSKGDTLQTNNSTLYVELECLSWGIFINIYSNNLTYYGRFNVTAWNEIDNKSDYFYITASGGSSSTSNHPFYDFSDSNPFTNYFFNYLIYNTFPSPDEITPIRKFLYSISILLVPIMFFIIFFNKVGLSLNPVIVALVTSFFSFLYLMIIGYINISFFVGYVTLASLYLFRSFLSR